MTSRRRSAFMAISRNQRRRSSVASKNTAERSRSSVLSGASSVHDDSIRSLSYSSWRGQVTSEDLDYDEDILKGVINDVGKHAYGVIGIEVWVLRDGQVTLSLEGGLWVDPVYRASNLNNPYLEWLIQEDEVLPAFPGIGVGGYMFSECGRGSQETHGAIDQILHATHLFDHRRQWSRLQDLVDDEDQRPDERMEELLKAGFGKAYGVPFRRSHLEGVVVYYARESADEGAIFGPLEQIHLASSADLIKSTLWMQRARRSVAAKTKKTNERSARSLKKALFKFKVAQAFKATRSTCRDEISQNKDEKPSSTSASFSSLTSFRFVRSFKSLRDIRSSQSIGQSKRVISSHEDSSAIQSRFSTAAKIWATKCKGAGKNPPPRKPRSELIVMFSAAFTHLLIVMFLDKLITEYFGETYGFFRGTIGSNTASFYALSAAPASQPRSFLFGQCMCVAISISIRYLSFVPTFIRASFTGAICLMAMGFFGIITPSASALALLVAYTSQDDPSMGWIKIATLLFQNFIMILLGTFINNLNSHHQYPATWTMVVWPSWPRRLFSRARGVLAQADDNECEAVNVADGNGDDTGDKGLLPLYKPTIATTRSVRFIDPIPETSQAPPSA